MSAIAKEVSRAASEALSLWQRDVLSSLLRWLVTRLILFRLVAAIQLGFSVTYSRRCRIPPDWGRYDCNRYMDTGRVEPASMSDESVSVMRTILAAIRDTKKKRF